MTQAQGIETSRPQGQRYRAALAGLVQLAQTGAAQELSLERAYAMATADASQWVQRLQENLNKREAACRKLADDRAAQQRAALEEQYQRDFQHLRETGRADLAAATHEDVDRQQKLQRQLKIQTGSADADYESVERRLEAIRQRVKDQTITRRNELESLREQGEKQLRRYGLKRVAKDVVSDEPPPRLAGDPKQLYEQQKQQAERSLRHLKRQIMPRLVSGYIKPVLAIAGISAAAGYVIMSYTDRRDWQDPEVLLGLGGTLLVVTIIVVLFKLMARAMARERYDVLHEAVTLGRQAADQVMDQSAEQRATEQREAERLRREAVAKAREQWDPKLREVEATLRKIREEHEQRFEQASSELTRKRDAALERANRDHRDSLERISSRYGRRRELAQERFNEQTTAARQAYEAGLAELRDRWNAQVAQSQAVIDELREVEREVFPPWDDERWKHWTPPTEFARVTRFGRFAFDPRREVQELHPRGFVDTHLPEVTPLPAVMAFPDRASMLLRAGQDGRNKAIATLQTVMARLLTSLPAGRARFTMVDPVGLGQSFAGFMHLADHLDQLVSGRIWTDRSHIEEQLADLTEHMENVIQKYLRNEYETIDQYNLEAGELAEPYRFLVVSDFPHGFTEESIRRLNSIAASGARCGVYTLIFHDTRQKLPREVSVEDIEQNAIELRWQDGHWVWQDQLYKPYALDVESPPDEEAITRLCHMVGSTAVKAGTVQVPFATIAPPPDKRWSRSSATELDVPVGRTGATRLQHVNLGHGVAQHALIAGKTGSGKSTLLHVMITNLALWYSPEQVEFYLVDFKKGVEFKAYANHSLPHARAIAIESDREFGLSVLQRLDGELTRRGDEYRRLGVQDMAAYRKAAPDKPLPRILLVVDEFQEFFSEEDKLAQDAALLLDRLVRQGRAFGIHVLLGSQSLGGATGLPRTTMGQMAVRVALQCSEADSQLILNDNNAAARLLTRPGEAIYNNQGGNVEGNSPFQISWLSDEQKDRVLAEIDNLASQRLTRRNRPIVFEGNARADIGDNALLAERLGAANWLPLDGPAQAWIGEPVAIKDPTSVAFRRQSGSNVLVVGQQDEAALSILMAAMVSLAAQHEPGRASFYVLDGSLADAPTAGRLEQLTEALPHETHVIAYRDVEDALGQLTSQLQQRQGAEGSDHAPVYVFIYAMQRYRMLRKSEDDFSFSMSEGDADTPAKPDKQFRDLVSEGPAVGMHTLAWCDTPIALERVVDRSLMREFDNRVLFQMSATDSSNLIDSPSANSLGFYRALWYSEEQGILEKFRPYAVPSPGWGEGVAEQFRSKTTREATA